MYIYIYISFSFCGISKFLFSFYYPQVSHNFTDIFKQLVPGGKAQLVMKKEPRNENSEEESQSQSESSSSQRSLKSFDEFSGISIKV